MKKQKPLFRRLNPIRYSSDSDILTIRHFLMNFVALIMILGIGNEILNEVKEGLPDINSTWGDIAFFCLSLLLCRMRGVFLNSKNKIKITGLIRTTLKPKKLRFCYEIYCDKGKYEDEHQSIWIAVLGSYWNPFSYLILFGRPELELHNIKELAHHAR